MTKDELVMLIRDHKDYGGHIDEFELADSLLSASIADTAKEMAHDAWKPAFDERHEFDVYPEHFMSGMRNEFAAGWHAALKAIAKEPK
ncbi:hypothetical protein [Caballeronia sp. ATUFL_M1_KS5A]|uniref:hypothetical protein n=1 Tax=Caballeronia sp. ATUFL_M1_KS5A TaxID=2921778 RepID=UPI0020291B42|nr:hypothetical protein [Caballeronia sp. ATUFL_M1_KS5A]